MRQNSIFKYYLPALITAAIGFILTTGATFFQHKFNQERIDKELYNVSQAVIKQTTERMDLYSTHIYGMRSAAIAIGLDNINQSFVQTYLNDNDLKKKFPGVQAIGIVKRISPTQENSFVAKMRIDGSTRFKIKQFSPNYQSRYVIQLVEPLEQEGFDAGTDLGSDSAFRTAANRAAIEGEAMMTPPITWDGKNNNISRSAIIFLPIYQPGILPQNENDRLNAIWGWVSAYISLGDIFENQNFMSGSTNIHIADVDSTKNITIYEKKHSQNAIEHRSPRQKASYEKILGRDWSIVSEENPDFIENLALTPPWLVMLIGSIITILTFLKIVDRKKRLLAAHISSEQNAVLAAIVENSADAIIGETLDGIIISWNQAASNLFLYSEQEAIGKKLQELIFFESDIESTQRRIQQALSNPHALSQDTVLKHRNGHAIDVHISIGLLKNKNGHVTGIANLIQDISERKKAEYALQEMHLELEHRVNIRTAELDKARNDLQTVLDAVPSMIGYWDRQLKNKIANKAYNSWYGTENILENATSNSNNSTLWNTNESHIKRVLLGHPQQFEKLLQHPNSDITKHAMVHLLPDKIDGVTIGFYGILHDVDEAVKSRISLLAERERLNNIIEGTHVGTWEWNIQTGEMIINEQWANMLGYTLEELAPTTIQTWTYRIHPEDAAQSAELLQSHFVEERGHYSCESRMRHKLGHWVWIQTRGRILSHTKQGDPEWMYGTQQDISVYKNNELEMVRIAGLLRSILQAATQMAIIATDTDGTMTVFNSGAELLLGYKAEECIGVTTPTMLFLQNELQTRREELRAEYRQNVEGFGILTMQANRTGAEEREWTFVRKDSSIVPVRLTVTTIHNDARVIIGYLAIAQDISQRKQIEATLLKAKASAEANSRAKSMFLANMSHEIRTPMNAVIGVSHLLESSNLDAQQRRLLSKLQIAGRSLLGIINDVLDLAKIEAGELQVESIPFHPSDIVRDIVTLFEATAQTKGLVLEAYISDALPKTLEGDSHRLRQILTNLVSNAIKFTERGSITIEVLMLESDDPDEAVVQWQVRDTGVGIAPDVLERLFSPFNQADASTTRRYGGTGLGLSIVRQLAQLMGGDAFVTSQLGTGSTFGVKVAFQRYALPSHTGLGELSVDLSHAPVLRVIVVDDAEDSRQALAAACHALGWQTQVMNSSEELIKEIQQCYQEQRDLPDAMLVDWQMPGVDGLTAILQLASEIDPNELPTALIVSAYSRNEIQALDQAHLVDEILLKPISPSELFNAVNKGVAKRKGKAHWIQDVAQTALLGNKTLNAVHVLVVDDSDINLEIARLLLEREGATVQTAVNGLEALTVLQETHRAFDAVLMDVQMPVMDGYESCRRIRGELGLGQLPIIALTAGALNEERQRAEAAGMNGFLTKPLDPLLMVNTLRQAIDHASDLLPSLLPTRPSPHADAPPNWPRISGIHAGTAFKQLGGDAALFLRLLQRMLQESHEQQWPMHNDEQAPDDMPAWLARIHKLRGSSGNLGALEIHQIASEIEQSLREDAVLWVDVLPQIRHLQTALINLKQAATPVWQAHQATQALLKTDANLGEPLRSVSAIAEQLQPLLHLLEQQDMEAMMELDRMSPRLIAYGASALVSELEAAMDLLDFASAHQLLTRCLEQTNT